MNQTKLYECKNCANRRSPLCKLCSTITSPSGKERKPTYYVSVSEIFSYKGKEATEEIEALAMVLVRCICAKEPLPPWTVMEYNEKIKTLSAITD